jgi:hypothetical protein
MMEFIAGGLSGNGNLFAVGTDGHRNCVRWTDGSIQEWVGSPVLCACSFRDGAICITSHGEIWRITNGEATQQNRIPGNLTVYGLTAINNERVIGVGTEGLFVEIDIHNGSSVLRKASEFGFRKPGRDILNVFKTKRGLVAIGKKELVYNFEEYPDPKGSSSSTGRESFFFYGTEFEGSLWLSGLLGRENILASFSEETNALYYHQIPDLARGRAACISSFRDQLVLANEQVFLGRPGNWSLIKTNAGERIVAIINRGIQIPMLLSSSGNIYALES